MPETIANLVSRVAALTGTSTTAASGRRRECEFGENKKYSKRECRCTTMFWRELSADIEPSKGSYVGAGVKSLALFLYFFSFSFHISIVIFLLL
jgi:hypothetical protein